MKRKIFLITLFIVFLISGFIFRLVWFFTFQKKIVEDKFFYKELKYDKGGAKTPQEAWNKYIDALEKGDIEEALLYVWPYEREGLKKSLEEKKKRNESLSVYKEDEKTLYELPPPYYLEKDEKVFTYLSPENQKKYLEDLLKDPILRKDYEAVKKGPLPYTDAYFLPTVIFKLNPYNKKWYIK